jgi:hypothetical protein
LEVKKVVRWETEGWGTELRNCVELNFGVGVSIATKFG